MVWRSLTSKLLQLRRFDAYNNCMMHKDDGSSRPASANPLRRASLTKAMGIPETPQSIWLIHYNLSWVFEHWVHIQLPQDLNIESFSFCKVFRVPFGPSSRSRHVSSPRRINVEVWVGIPVWRRPWCGDGSEDLEAGNGSSCKLVLGARHWAFLGSIKMSDAYLGIWKLWSMTSGDVIPKMPITNDFFKM